MNTGKQSLKQLLVLAVWGGYKSNLLSINGYISICFIVGTEEAEGKLYDIQQRLNFKWGCCRLSGKKNLTNVTHRYLTNWTRDQRSLRTTSLSFNRRNNLSMITVSGPIPLESAISTIQRAPTAAASIILRLPFHTDSSLIFRVVFPTENSICINQQ